MSKSSGTNYSNAYKTKLYQYISFLGDYSSEDPPLPIPNREVKLTCADGTTVTCGRVCRRRSSKSPPRNQGAFSSILLFLIINLLNFNYESRIN